MPHYEHVFLARQDITAQQMSTLQKGFETIVQELGGKIGKTEYWGVKNLAYKIRKNRKAHFALMNIDAPHAAVAEMERQMSLSPDVIRFITIRVEEPDEGQSAMMKRGDDRGERGDRDGRDRDRGDRGDRGGRDRGDRGDRGPRRDRGPRSDNPGEGND
jgi:small subunit ribosomal protein S6